MAIKNLKFNTTIKYVISGLILSFIIVGAFGIYTIKDLQERTDKTYADFAQLLTKTIAAQTDKNTSNIDSITRQFNQFVETDNDISFIEYKNQDNVILYSSKNLYKKNDEKTIINVSSPVVLSDNTTIGTLTVGLNGKGMNLISSEYTETIIFIFSLLGLSFACLLLLNFLLITKELKKLYKGVKQISTGQFGFTLESENMPELTDAFNNMSNILSQYEEENIEQLMLERNKLEAVLMSIINGVIVCDNFDNVVLANSAALSMLDIEEKSFLNTKIQDYIDSHGQKCFLEKIEEFKDTPLNIIEQKPIELNIEAGKKTIKAMISPMFSQQQDYVGYIIVLIDITRETEVNKLKNTFISNVSHELRTPVTVLRTYIDTLCNNGDDFDEATKHEFMQTIDTEAKRLHSMVNDILDFSRLESGNVSLKKEYSNIVDLIRQNINSIKVLADEKNIKINFEPNENTPKVPINVESIDRVIRNLLSNAIKYSLESKDILVSSGISDDSKQVWFSVKDNGIGIEKEHLAKIFERFYRVENATHTVKGTGLGLHLVKMTVEKYHNGKITVSSVINEGSTFTVYLPLEIDESELL